MNCLSHMLNLVAEAGRFGYHYSCKKTKLTHLCFADDLLIFTDGSLLSIQNVLQVLNEFEMRSGLAVSRQKSSSALVLLSLRKTLLWSLLECRVGISMSGT